MKKAKAKAIQQFQGELDNALSYYNNLLLEKRELKEMIKETKQDCKNILKQIKKLHG